jgi:hypothetical protein
LRGRSQRFQEQEAPGGYRRPQKVPGSPRRPPGGSRRPQETPEAQQSFRSLQDEPPGSSRRLREARPQEALRRLQESNGRLKKNI